jgi:hypothetical protein
MRTGAAAQLLSLERDLRESIRGGYLFGNFDEPLDAAGMRIVRVIQQRLSDLPCECVYRTRNGVRCRACGGRLPESETTRTRCPARSPGGVSPDGTLPRKGTQCGLDAGHDGDHTVLMKSSAPWWPNKAT